MGFQQTKFVSVNGGKFGKHSDPKARFRDRWIAPTVPFPDFTNTVRAWGLFNFNNAGYPAGAAVNATGDVASDDAFFTADAPYPVDYAAVQPTWGTAPYILGALYDQNITRNFNGAAGLDIATPSITFNGTTQGLQAASLTEGITAATIYILVKRTANNGVILENGTTGTADGDIQISWTGTQLNVRLYGNTGQLQRKTKTIGDANFHVITVAFDTALATADQLVVKVDDSATDVNTSSAGDLAGQSMGNATANLGASNNATSNFMTGQIPLVIVRDVKDNDATQTAWVAKIQDLYNL